MKKTKLNSPGCKVETYITQPLHLNAFELFIFDNSKNMEKGAKKWLIQHNFNNKEDYEGLGGLVFEQKKEKYIKDENKDEYRIFAAMFLAEEHLTPDLIAHECVHAALTLERNIIRYQGLYDGNDGSGYSAEERLAYAIGDFTESIIRLCIKRKVKLKLIMEKKKD